jgi:hypothetical protein
MGSEQYRQRENLSLRHKMKNPGRTDPEENGRISAG